MGFFDKKDESSEPSPFGRTPGTKVCSRCHQALQQDQFRAHRKTTDGLNAWCIPCDAAYKREYYQKRKEAKNVSVQ